MALPAVTVTSPLVTAGTMAAFADAPVMLEVNGKHPGRL
jgi:hypothetical protein